MRNQTKTLRRILGLTALFCSLAVLPHTCFAETLALASSSSLTAESTGDGTGEVLIKGTYSMTNDGDEKAIEILPKLSLGTWSWAGKPVSLDPAESYTWNLDAQITKEQLSCAEDRSCSGLVLPLRGAFPLIVTRFYQDTNGYQFSAPEVIRLIVGQNSDSELARLRAPNINGRFALEGDGQQFSGEMEVLSRAVEARKLAIQFIATEELKVKKRFAAIDLNPVEDGKVSVDIENFRGLNGSSYPIFAVVQWDDAGVRNVLVRFALIAVNPVGKANTYIGLAVASVAIVLLVLFFVLKKGEKKEA